MQANTATTVSGDCIAIAVYEYPLTTAWRACGRVCVSASSWEHGHKPSTSQAVTVLQSLLVNQMHWLPNVTNRCLLNKGTVYFDFCHSLQSSAASSTLLTPLDKYFFHWQGVGWLQWRVVVRTDPQRHRCAFSQFLIDTWMPVDNEVHMSASRLKHRRSLCKYPPCYQQT